LRDGGGGIGRLGGVGVVRVGGEPVEGGAHDRGVDRVQPGEQGLGVALSGQYAAQCPGQGLPVVGGGELVEQVIDGGGRLFVAAGGGDHRVDRGLPPPQVALDAVRLLGAQVPGGVDDLGE